jgi:polar amino acid transport system substrate-binding protein
MGVLSLLKPQNLSQPPSRHALLRGLDLAAVLTLCVYAWLAIGASGGGAGGPALDPIWQAARQRGTLRVAVDLGFRPFADQIGGQPAGYDIDLARAVAAKLGLGVELVPTGYDALYDSLTSGRADLIASALPYAPEQGYRARFSSFYFDDGQVLVVPQGSPVTGAQDLAGLRLGVPLGSDADALARRLATATPSITLRSSYDTPGEALAALRAGQLDAALVDNVAALTATQASPGLRIAAALSSEPLALAVPARAFQLHAEVNRALAELRADGLFERLNARWFR